ncbi:hypothetical protein AAU61_11630 [Desulfocarbo indianensis]|nr:hypothetical protein AAU61_11630 [Desulfocarbo indianensis]
MPGLIYPLAIFIALAAGWLLMAMAGHDAFSVYTQAFSKVFLSWHGLSETLVQAVPLGMGALGVAMAARLKLWNIGVEGQFMFGAFCATGLALYLDTLPAVALLPLMLVAGFMGGGLLAALCGLLRARLGINEIVTTLLLNYVVGLWVGYLVYGPWQALGSNVPETTEFAAAAQLPVIFPGTRVHLGLVALLIFAALCHFFLNNSVWGYRIRACGDNPRAARTAGIDYKRSVLLVMLLSGGLAGAGGMLEVSGAVHRLQDGTTPFFTMTVFMAAWLARLDLAGILVAGFLLAGLQVAGYYMQFMGLPSALVTVIEGVALLSMIAFEPLRLNALKRAGKGA